MEKLSKVSFERFLILIILLSIGSFMSSSGEPINNNSEIEFGQPCRSEANAPPCKFRNICVAEGFCARREAYGTQVAANDAICHQLKPGTFLELETGLCKCYLNKPCSAGNLCPLHSSPSTSDNSDITNITCICNNDYNFAEWESKECIQSKLYGQNCTVKGRIDPCLQGTKCSFTRGTCGCEAMIQYWDPLLEKCFGKYSYCRRDNDGVCGRYTSCSYRNECGCKNGYYKNNEGRCIADFGSACEIGTDSKDYGVVIDCVDKVCQFGSMSKKCTHFNTVYDEVVGKCIQMVDEYNSKLKCYNWNSSEFQCGRDAKTTRCAYDVCRCTEELLPTGDKLDCVEGKGYGEVCDEGLNPCAKKYNCSSEGTCSCRDLAVWNETNSLCYSDIYCKERYRGTFYDIPSGTCKCRIGDACVLESRNNVSLSSCPAHSNSIIYNGIQEYDGKISYAGHCECENGYTANPNQTICVEAKGYGETCNDELGEFCESRSRASCIDNVCTCNATRQIWDRFEKKCGTKVGASCFEWPIECTRNSVCQIQPYEGYYNVGPIVRTCDCLPKGYSATEDGRCLGDYLSECSGEQRDCQDGLVCVDGLCHCPDMAGQIYDKGLQQCIGLVGSVCAKSAEVDSNSSAITRQCVETSHCDPTSGKCTCNPGLVTLSTIREKCFNLSKYGENCSDSNCDVTKGLACIDQKCSCVDIALNYKNEEEGCQAPIGFKCGNYRKWNVCTARRECEYYYTVGCEQGGVCTDIGGVSNQYFVCKQSTSTNTTEVVGNGNNTNLAGQGKVI